MKASLIKENFKNTVSQHYKITRSSVDAHKPARRQSRSPNMVPFDMLGMVSY